VLAKRKENIFMIW